LRPSIIKNDTNLKKLNNLITNGFYSGQINSNDFELIRNHFPNNFRIIGSLNDGNFEIRSDYTTTMSFLRKFLLVICFIISIYFLITQNWLFLIFIILFTVFDFIYLKIKTEKEINLFTDKLLQLNRFE
jgi:hypothetical protein